MRGNDEFEYSKHKRIVEGMLARWREERPELRQIVFRPGTIVGPVKPMEGTERISGDGSAVVTAVVDSPSLRLVNVEWHDLDAATHPSLAVSACGPIQTNANLENTGDGLMYVTDGSGQHALISMDGGYTIVQRGDAPTDPLTSCARQDFNDFPGQTPSRWRARRGVPIDAR